MRRRSSLRSVPTPDRAQVDVLALRAGAGRALAVVAVVAAQLAAALVQGQARVATRAQRHPAAVVAQQGRREAAAVEEHQHLLAGGEGLADQSLQRRRKAAVQRPAAHVEALEARRLGAAGAAGQAQQGVAALVGVVQAFQRGGGRAEQQRHALQARAHHRQVAGVVAQAFLLLVGRVVLLVDDDQPRILQRGEQRRAGADDDLRAALAGRLPGVQALAVGQPRVQQGDARVEAPGEALQGLGGRG